MIGKTNAPFFDRKVIASPCAGLLVHWMKERHGDLVFFHLAHEGAYSELSWCPADQFHACAAYVQCGEVGGCPLYVALGDLEFMRPGHIAIDVTFDGHDEEALVPRLVSHVRLPTTDEIERQAFARECDAGEASDDLLWESEQLTLALFGRLSASGRR